MFNDFSRDKNNEESMQREIFINGGLMEARVVVMEDRNFYAEDVQIEVAK